MATISDYGKGQILPLTGSNPSNDQENIWYI